MERSVLVVSVIINNSLHLKLLGASFASLELALFIWSLTLSLHVINHCHIVVLLINGGFFLAALRKTLFWV